MDEKYAEIEARLAALETENKQFFWWGWIVVFVLNVFAAVRVCHSFLYRMPRMEKMFAEMLAGEPLPMSTRLCIAYGNVPVIVSIVLIVALVLLGLKGSKRHLPTILGAGVISLGLQFLLLAWGNHAQFAPLIRLIERLG